MPHQLRITLCLASLLSLGSGASEPARDALEAKGFEAAWIDGLAARGEPRWYRGEELRFIGQTVGGQYAGQLYLGGDGRLWYWDIFNERFNAAFTQNSGKVRIELPVTLQHEAGDKLVEVALVNPVIPRRKHDATTDEPTPTETTP